MSEVLSMPVGQVQAKSGRSRDLLVACVAAAVVLATIRLADFAGADPRLIDFGVLALTLAGLLIQARKESGAPATTVAEPDLPLRRPPAAPDRPLPAGHAVDQPVPHRAAEVVGAPASDAVGNERPSRVADELLVYGNVMDVLGAHIDASVDETSKSALTMIGGLQALDGAIETLLGDIRTAQSVSSLTITRGRQAMLENAKLVSDLRATILTSMEDAGQDRKTYEDIANQANVFASALDSIARIAKQTRYLALNATVEAVRAGGAGQGFALIAAEIRSLADAAGAASEEVRHGLQMLRETTNRRMKQKLDVVEEINLLDDVENHSRAAVVGFEDLSRHQNETLSMVQHVTQNAASHLMGVLAQTQVQDIVRQRLDNVKTSLDRLGHHAAMLADGLLDETQRLDSVEDAVLARMKDDYVMAGQHDVHRRMGSAVSPAKQATALPSIELF